MSPLLICYRVTGKKSTNNGGVLPARPRRFAPASAAEPGHAPPRAMHRSKERARLSPTHPSIRACRHPHTRAERAASDAAKRSCSVPASTRTPQTPPVHHHGRDSPFPISQYRDSPPARPPFLMSRFPHGVEFPIFDVRVRDPISSIDVRGRADFRGIFSEERLRP